MEENLENNASSLLAPVQQGNAQQPKKKAPRACNFWHIVFGSMLGFVFTQILLTILGLMIVIGMIATIDLDDSVVVSKNSVLELKLNSPIVERMETDMSILGQYAEKSIALSDILKAFHFAATDDNIKGVSLNVGMAMRANVATLTEIRRAITEFRSTGKFVYAYGDVYGQGAYYLASAADKLFINPHGTMDLRGMSSQILFYKGLIDKLGIDVQVVKCGKFKSAVEPYLMDRMSQANREQTEVYLRSIWGEITNAIAQSRGISVERINDFADSLLIRNGEDAVNCKLIDTALYLSDYHRLLRKKAGVPEREKLTLISVGEYVKTLSDSHSSPNKIAVIYACGEINNGKGGENTIGDATMCQSIREAMEDKQVKAIVLRVNSPGGSALASEIIWNEIENAKKAGKTVVTSMGDYAASGGYYISCNSDYIVAEPTTITGSIGVFGVVPSVGRFMESKFGITTDKVSTNAHSDLLSGFRTMDEQEYEWLQGDVNRIYETFLKRVSDGRKIAVAQVDSIGQGRVWSGKDAIKIGLVDTLGNLNDAIAMAARLAKIDDYKVCYPDKKSVWETILKNESDGTRKVEMALREELGELYPMYHAMKKIRDMKGIQARMPMEFIIQY